MRHDHAGERGREHEKHQPRDAVFPDLKRAGTGVRTVTRRDTGHFLDVFGGLLLHDVDDVVDRDDADEAAFLVHDRDGEQVIVRELFRDVLLVVRGAGVDDVRVHDVLKDLVIVAQKQILDRDDALQPALGGCDIADVDGLLVLADAADAGDGLADGHVFLQVDVLRRHDAAGGIFGVLEVFVDERARLGVGRAHDALDDVRGQLLHHVDRVVDAQVFNDVAELGVGDGVDDGLLLLDLQIRKHVGRDLLREQTEHHAHTRLVGLPELAEKFRDIELVHLRKRESELLDHVLLEHDKQLVMYCFVIDVLQCGAPLSSGFMQ